MSLDAQRWLALPAAHPIDRNLAKALTSVVYQGKDPDACLMLGQTSALLELMRTGGVLAPLPVGNGKTLVTLLAPTLLNAERPMLVVPADLVEKTKTEFAQYLRDGWKVRLPKLISYTKLSLRQHETAIVDYQPDLLIFDECMAMRNTATAAWRRIARALVSLRPRPKVAMLGGTIIDDSIMSWYHMVIASLRDGAPVPITRAAAERLDQAVKQGDDPLAPVGGFYAYALTRQGIAQPERNQQCNASIRCSFWDPGPGSPELQEAIYQAEVGGMRPDGEMLGDWDSADMLSQLALGLYLQWDPMPPKWWLTPRARYARYVRDVKAMMLTGHDTDAQVADRVRDGSAPMLEEGVASLAAWELVKDEFTPNSVPVWLDTSIVEAAVQRTKKQPTLIWTKWRAVGYLLQELGVPYYGGGTAPHEAPLGTIACSLNAHHKGKNMQRWHRNLLMTPTPNAEIMEQLIGRTHRKGQTADTVYVEFVAGLDHHKKTIRRARSSANRITKNSKLSQKLTLADWVTE